MGDFIWTNRSDCSGIQCEEALGVIYKGISRRIHSRQGKWGVFAWAENPYPGYDVYEDGSHLAFFLAGPLINLPQTDVPSSGNAITRTFFQHWKQQQHQVDWSQALDGPFCFVVLDKKVGTLQVVTDRASFVPVYYKGDQPSDHTQSWSVSSHVGVLAKVVGCDQNTDPVSMVDFLFTYTVTFPYTLYQEVYQMDPGSIWDFIQNGLEKQVYYHFRDHWTQEKLPIDEAAAQLRKGIQNYILRVTEGKKQIGLLLSAGSDSRVIAKMLPQHPNKHAYTFTDSYNRESKIASEIARITGLQHHAGLRSLTHYLDHMEGCVRLVGPQDHFYHCHTFGFRNFEGLGDCDVLFGGLFADAFLKGSHILSRRQLRFGPKAPIKRQGGLRIFRGRVPINLDKQSLELVSEARKRRFAFVESIWGEGNPLNEEWETLWPASMNHNWTNFACNRRLFPSYEPFCCNIVLQISQRTSQRDKLVLRLFRKAFLPELSHFHHIPHGEGHYPSHSEWENFRFRARRSAMNRIKNTLSIPQINHGPWPNWNEVVRKINWKQINIAPIISNTDVSQWSAAAQLALLQVVTATQLK